MKQGDVVLIWGASGGLGSYATQLAIGGGATPVCVVSSPAKADIVPLDGRRADHRPVNTEGYQFWKDEHTQDPKEWQRLGKKIRELTGGDDADIVFEHPGRETFGASVYVARRGGTIVTCASTSGFLHEYDNRYLWMNLKRIIGSHFANYREAWEANRLIHRGRIHPTLSRHVPARGDRPGRLRRAPQRPPGQGRRALPRPRRGPRCAQPRAACTARDRHQPVPRRLSGSRRTARAAHRARPRTGPPRSDTMQAWRTTPPAHRRPTTAPPSLSGPAACSTPLRPRPTA